MSTADKKKPPTRAVKENGRLSFYCVFTAHGSTLLRSNSLKVVDYILSRNSPKVKHF